MGQKSNRPYNNKKYKSNRNNKNRGSNLENTTRIRIDTERLNDYETLDTSFLEGRLDKKGRDSRKLKEKLLIEKRDILFNLDIVKKVFFSIATICLIILVVLFLLNNKIMIDDTKNESKNFSEDTYEIDDNYLFLGDFNTEKYDFEGYDYHYNKVSEDSMTTDKILENLKNNVYDYNPSIIFIELGIVELGNGESQEKILHNFEKIIDEINNNRPYAIIYIESLYPINKDVDDYDSDVFDTDLSNDDIISFNKSLKSLAKSKKINYLDLFSLLSEDNSLNDEYTDNGIYLNEEGYEVVKKEIEKIVG